MKNHLKVLTGLSLFIFATASQAGIVFTFTETGGGVTMTSSGTIDTNGLVLQNDVWTWGGTGVEENGNHDIMGGTNVGGVDISFGFNDGTDFSPWATANGPWASDNFNWTIDSGVKGFTTYIRPPGGGIQLPGLGVERADLVNGLWSPDQMWSQAGASFASLNMFEGVYTVTDAVSGEFITFQIGGGNAVPEPASLLLTSLGLLGFGAARRRK